MKALVLAAGYGTRLRPLTELIPKCLAPIQGIPLLGIWLDRLFASGIDHVVINLHYLDNIVRDYVASTPFRDDVTLLFEEELQGTAATLIKNSELFADGVMLIHGDNLSHFDIDDFIAAHRHRPKDTLMTMMTFITRHPETCGVVALDAKGVVQGFYEKVSEPPSQLANGAIYLISPEMMALMAEMPSDVTDFSTQVIPGLLGQIYAWHNSCYHLDIGQWHCLLQAQKDFHYPLNTALSTHYWQQFWRDSNGQKLNELALGLCHAGVYQNQLLLPMNEKLDKDRGLASSGEDTHASTDRDTTVFSACRYDGRKKNLLLEGIADHDLLLIGQIDGYDAALPDTQFDCLALSRR